MKKENIEKLKNAIIVILVLIIVFGASYFTSELQNCSSKSDNKSTETASNSNTASTDDVSNEEEGDLIEIGINDYLDLMEKDEASIIYVARPTCHFCEEMEPIIRNIVYEYKVEVNYLNTDELSDSDQAKFIKSDDYFEEKGGYGTPLLLIVKDGEIKDIQEGLSEKETTVNFLKDNDLIKE